ncbi:MAG: hypothetical protein NTY39_11195 [Campylobacterales bacterium]|nr:hypothetical protein [Campylobacterales bacterium]
MTTSTINRDEYITSISTITDQESRRFANQALVWWDRHFSWNVQGCNVLTDDNNIHVCYLFGKIDRYSEYLTIYNLFTPLIEQRQGYAHELLGSVIEDALKRYTRRITFSSVSDSLDFYTGLGFIFWGINTIGDYHCDLPIPKEGLNGFSEMTQTVRLKVLLGEKIEKIYAKVNDNEKRLSEREQFRLNADRIKLARKWNFEELQACKQEMETTIETEQ